MRTQIERNDERHRNFIEMNYYYVYIKLQLSTIESL